MSLASLVVGFTGGAAVKAGVHEGDRIIKVNGSLVSTLALQEVVKLIKCDSEVQKQASQILRKMLEQEEAEPGPAGLALSPSLLWNSESKRKAGSARSRSRFSRIWMELELRQWPTT
ncbi:hypothetical protein AAFF_G00072820 [Aldrovandia affinis]|uniref:PDZ domain-containing protein n=1 Tax=Aldrovandia affinis TaxID=143900 RepID=A0AAD7R1K2_9TELE|nr:hypothetical protein AAFF_G00072820 [Aldrovandia affinis]